MIKYEKIINSMQRSEITEHYVYQKLSQICKDKENKKILERISKDELKHYHIWKSITKKPKKPNKMRIYFYVFLARIFGLSFALRLMEGGEENAQKIYDKIGVYHKEALEIKKDEIEHENSLIRILNDKKLSYAGAIVLGLNDALVELTGTLAGISFAFNNTSIIAITGLIMGIAAALSMAASSYLESKESDEKQERGVNALTSALYTGVAYIITVIFLVAPYFVFENVYYALTSMLINTIVIIALYTAYISIAKEVSFKNKFFSMAFISLGVAFISFIIGYVVKIYFGIDV